MSPGYRIIFLSIAAAVLYGLVMDQITVRVCIEYFSIAHKRLDFIPPDSPTLLALAWGVIATWWVGLMLGIPLAIACRAGSLPKLKPRAVVRPLAILLLVMAGMTLVAGITGYVLAKKEILTPGEWAPLIPAAAHVGFVSNACAHLAAYATGFIGGIVLIILTVRRRRLAAAGAKAKKPVL